MGLPREKLTMLLSRAVEPEWFQGRFGDFTAEYLRRLLGLESMAIGLTTYDVRLVSGLLQTPGYASCLIRTGLHIREWGSPEMAMRVALRQERQRRVFEQADPPRCVFLMDESVLIRRVGSDAVMLGQMLHLLAIADDPNITIRFVLLDRLIAGNEASMAGGMAHLQFGRGGLPDLVYVEGYGKADYYTKPARSAEERAKPWPTKDNEFERHLQLLLRIQGEACASPADSRLHAGGSRQAVLLAAILVILAGWNPPQTAELRPLDAALTPLNIGVRSPVGHIDETWLFHKELLEDLFHVCLLADPAPIASGLRLHEVGDVVTDPAVVTHQLTDHDEAARGELVDHPLHQGLGANAVRQAVQHGDEQGSHRLGEVDETSEVWVPEDGVGVRHVDWQYRGVVVLIQQRLPQRQDNRVVVDIHDAGLGVGILGDLVHVPLGRQAGAEVDELLYPVFLSQDPDDSLEEPPVVQRDLTRRRGNLQQELAGDSVHFVVIATTQQPVVHPRCTWQRQIDMLSLH